MSKINRHPVRRTAAGVLASTLVLSGAVAAATPAHAADGFRLDRLAGDNRYETSARIASAFGPTTGAILASGEPGHVVDALSANFLAGVRQQPVLLTTRNNIPDLVMERLEALIGERRVTIVGGPAAVSPEVEATLKAAGYTVTRLAGDDRYGTSEAIIESVPSTTTSDVGLVASGTNFPDALAGGPLAYKGKHPVFLAAGGRLPADTVDAIRASGVSSVIILGGTAAVPSTVVEQLRALGITIVERLGGAGRSETSRIIADYLIENFGFTEDTFNVASGVPRGEGADALSGAALSGKENRALLITDNVTSAAPVVAFAAERAEMLTDVGHIFGGPAAVSVELETRIELAGSEGVVTDPVALTAATVVAGGALTGTITGDFSSVTVTGCGFTDQAIGADDNATEAGRQFTLNVPASQAAGACNVVFTLTPTDGGAAMTQTVAVDVTARPTNQTLTVVPQEAAVNLVSAAGTNTGAREYSVSGLTAAATYDVVLFDAENVTITNGVVSFDDEENVNGGTVVEGNDQADAGSTPAVIEQVNGLGVVPASSVEAVAAADGTVTFLIDSTVPTSVVPVVFLDAFDGTDADTTADDNNLLDLGADNTPLAAEMFAVGGQKTWTPAEAADLQPTVDETITAVDKTANSFVTGTADAAKFYLYEAEDAFFIGDTRVSQADFERAMSTGDVLDETTVYFNEGDAETANDGPSTFVLNDVTPAAPATVAANRLSDSSVLVQITDNTEPGDVDNFNVYRAALSTTVTSCPDALSGYTLVGTIAPDAGMAELDALTDTGLAPNTTYCYTVTAVLDGDESDFSSADVVETTTLAAGGTALPESIDTFVSDDTDADAGPFEQLGTVNSGDVWTVVFDEPLASADGVIRVSDAGGATADVNCNSAGLLPGQTVATCSLNATTTTIDGTEYAANRVLTITVGALGTVTGDGVLSYPLTVTQAAGFADADNDGSWNPTGDPDNSIDNEGNKTIVVGTDTTPPAFSSAVAEGGTLTMLVAYDDVLNIGSVDSDGSDFVVTLTDGTALNLVGAAASGNEVTLTFTGSTFVGTETGSVTLASNALVEDDALNDQLAGSTIGFTTTTPTTTTP